jgi:hypothetical protein
VCLQNIDNKWFVAKISVINGLAPEVVRGFFELFISISSVAVGVKLIRQIWEEYIHFVICLLAGFPGVWGLDKIFAPLLSARR